MTRLDNSFTVLFCFMVQYDHRTDAGNDFDGFENDNLVDDPQFKVIVAQMSVALRRQFDNDH